MKSQQFMVSFSVMRYKFIFGRVLKNTAENTVCRINVKEIDALYAEFQPKGVVHSNAPLQERPWGTLEFGVVDEDGTLITFFEETQQD
jgi:uncharacterized glyoxalase superfamily protein PhnB